MAPEEPSAYKLITLSAKYLNEETVMTKIKIFGVHLQRWHLYFVIPLLCLMIAGCAAGLLLVGTALSGSSGESSSSGSSVQRRVSGLVFSQGSENVIAPLGGATVSAEWGSTRSILGAFTKAVTITASTTTNSDGSYELDGIDDNATVYLTIEKDGYTDQEHNVSAAGASPSVKGTLNRENQNKKTIFSATENDVNTDSDFNEKGEAIANCHIIITSSAIAGDTEVDLTPYYSLDNLPMPIPDGYIGLAGADFRADSIVLFNSGKEAKPYIILPSYVRSSDLAATNIKLMELKVVSGVKQWVVSKNSSNQDRKCKYYSSGAYAGMIGPDDSALEDNQAKLLGIRPFCFVYSISQLATITGSIKNTSGVPIYGAMVFGGGAYDTTDASGNYVLSRVLAISATSDTLVMVNAIAPNYQLAYAVAAVRPNNTEENINIILETLDEVAILGGSVKDAATISPIATAKVVCTTQPYVAAFVYDNKGTALDYSDDVISVTQPSGVNNYTWSLIDPNGDRYQSPIQSNNYLTLNGLFVESGDSTQGSYRVDLAIELADKTVTATAGFMMRMVNIGGGMYQQQITDIKLPVSMDPSITMEAYSNTLGNYRMIGVPSGVELQLQASKSGYQASGIRTVAALTQGQTKEENFLLNAGSDTVASIWITPAPSLTLQTGQSVQFSGVAKDTADNTISPTPAFTWLSSNAAIGSINSGGLLSATGSGNITIQATTGAVTSNSVTVQVGGLPAAPSSFAAVASSSSQIDLSWTDNSANEECFYIERSLNGITYAIIANPYPNTVAYNDTGLSANTLYYYRIYSYNANGDSSKVSASTSTPSVPVPAGPTALIVTAVDSYTINLEWTDNSDNETYFQIQRSSTGIDGSFAPIDTVPANNTTYQDTGLTAKSYNYYRVYAFNDSGNSTTYASGWAQTPDTIPNAPTGLAASTTSSSAITLTWADNSGNETGFKIERSPNGVDTWTGIYTTSSSAIMYSNSGLTYNTTYYYRIRSYNTAGNSNYTTVVYATTNQAAPSAPTGAGLTVLSDTSIRINWTGPSDNEDGFKVQISTNGTTYTLKTTTAANAVVFTDTGLTQITTYYYRVYAYNSVGDSAFSDVVSDTTQAPPIPADPTNLITTTVTSSSIGLQWNDNSNNETGFNLARSPNGSSDWVNLTTTAASVIAFSDTALTPSTTFYYRVAAYNAGGDSGYATLTAATLAVPDNLAFSVEPVNRVAGATMADVKVQVRDASNNPLPLDGVPITITINKGVLNGTLSRNTVAGVATFNDLSITTADTAYAITASSGALTPDVSTSFDITYAAANNLTWVTPPVNTTAGQTMAAFTVRVRDVYANNVQNTTVSITATNSALVIYQGGSTVAYATASSGADGLATFSTISMTAAGTGYVFRASSGALATTDSVSFNITPAAVDNLAFVQQPTTTSAGAIMSPPVTVRVRDAYNNVMPIQSISITTTNGTLMYGTLTQDSNASGIATFSSLSMTDIANDYVLSATCGAVSTTSSAFDITAGAANLSFIQQPANTVAGVTMGAIQVKAQNESYVPMIGVSVSITTTNGALINGTLTQDTDGDGIATFTPLSITLAANSYVLSASAGGYTTIVSTAFNITPASANNLTFSVQPANTVAGTTMAGVKVQVKDQYANLVPSVTVSLTTTAQLNGVVTVSSDSGGVATFNDLSITATGTYQLSARAGAIGPTDSNSFDITPAAVMTVTVSGDDPITSGIESSSYTAVSKDSYNNTVSDTYTWSKSNGTGTANLGVDTLTGVLSGTVTITATSVSAPSKSGGKTVTVNPGALSSLTFVQQPTTATINVNITPAVTVIAEDISGNDLSGVSVSISTTNGTAISGTLTKSSNTSGIATFDNLSIAIEGNYSFKATSGATNGTSASFNILPTLPDAPSGLAAAALSPTAITISWTDNSTNETGFRIERFISGSWQEITTVGADVSVYTNTGLTGNTFYNYKVRAYNAAGNSAYCTESNATTPPMPPDAPSDLVSSTITASTILLEWVDNATNEDGFKLQRSLNGITYTNRATPAPDAGSYNDTGLTENTPYWYRIYAYNAGGNSGYAGPISATTLLPLPSAPTTLTANAVSSSRIDLQWTDTAYNEAGFKLERSPNGSTGWNVVLTPTANTTSISNTGLASSTTYYYRICAYNATGNSGYTSNASATTAEVSPNAPTNLTITSTLYNFVTMTWTDTATNELGFKLERKVGVGSYSQVATPTAKAGTGVVSYTDTTVSASTNYYYQIKAYNVAGDSAYSNAVSTTTPAPPIPISPTNLITTTVTASSVGMQWQDNSSNEEKFYIERNYSGTGYAPLDNVSAGVTTYNNSGLVSGANYKYQVRAWNGGGYSGYTNEISVTTPLVAPLSPTVLTTAVISNTMITIQWQDNSDNETKFYIDRSLNGITYTADYANVSANTISWENSGLSYSSTYWYRVRAWNTAGYSGYSNVISGTTLGPPPPNAPSNLVATAQSISMMQLQWTDNSGDETGFKIYRSIDGVSYTYVASTTAGATIYWDMPISYSVQYWYAVRAYNAYGNSSATGAQGMITLKPDAMIRLSSEAEASYLTDGIYESTPISQTKSQEAQRNQWVTYYVRVQNDGNIWDNFKITGTYSSGMWTVAYYDELNTNITFEMTNSGYYPAALAPASYITIRAEVSHTGAETGQTFDAKVWVTSLNDQTKYDSVKATAVSIPTYYIVSGDVYNYSSKIGRIYLDMRWSGGGEPGVGTSIVSTGANPIPYTIRGVQPGSYYVNGNLDHIGSGAKNAGNPSGSIYTDVWDNVSGLNLYIYDVFTPTPSTPTYIQVYPADKSGLAFFDTPKDGNGNEIADAYNIYWDIVDTVSTATYLGYRTVPAMQDSANFITPLTNGQTYYFIVTALVGADESVPSSVSAPVLIGSTSGSYNVSGAILYPGVSPAGPLYVGVYNESGAISCTRIESPSYGSQSYSFAGVANGTYMLFAILDMNGNGLIDVGDYKNTEQGTMITVNNADLIDQNSTLPTGNADYIVGVEHSKYGTSHNYSVNIKARNGRQMVVAMELISGTGVTSVIDVGKPDREFRYSMQRGSSRPITSESYTINVTYSDATTETLYAAVTTVLLRAIRLM